MKLLATIPDPTGTDLSATPKLRTTARAILRDASGLIAIMYVGSNNYHKLPGGGLDDGETLEQGLAREILEETGCALQNAIPIGMVEEYRAKWDLRQISYGFMADIDGPKGQPDFTESERDNGFVLKWLPHAEAITLMESEIGNPDYEAYFITRRELAILKASRA